MQFKAVKLQRGTDWAIVLTTPEGDDHTIPGFSTAADAETWSLREIGMQPQPPLVG